MTELNNRPRKIPKFQKACEGSKSSKKKRVLKWGELEDDEYIRQYSLFYYQFHKTEGFTIDWEQFDYAFNTRPFDNSPSRVGDKRSDAAVMREMTLFAIQKHNEANGTKLVFVEQVEGNYQYTGGLLCWLTFWAMDMNSSSPEPKIYQVKMWYRPDRFKIYIFRLKPTEEEIASVDVEPPPPTKYDNNEPAVVFARAGPEDKSGLPFVFHRIGAGHDP